MALGQRLAEAFDAVLFPVDLVSRLAEPLPHELTQAQFDEQSGKLDEQFLENAAREIASIKSLSTTDKVYGMGFIQGPDGKQQPVALDPGMIESSMRRTCRSLAQDRSCSMCSPFRSIRPISPFFAGATD